VPLYGMCHLTLASWSSRLVSGKIIAGGARRLLNDRSMSRSAEHRSYPLWFAGMRRAWAIALAPTLACGGGESTSSVANEAAGAGGTEHEAAIAGAAGSANDGGVPPPIPEAAVDANVAPNDASSENDELRDVTPEERLPVTCEGKTCGENQYCIHTCRCGIQPLPDSGIDCTPPAPYCADALPLRPGQNFSADCSKMCNGPPVCQLISTGNVGCTCG
jgi:hypothetical protein